jgi:predicted acetyltransferase
MVNIKINKAKLAEKPILQNLARFYIHDLSQFQKRKCPDNGLFEDEDYIRYWEGGNSAFLIRCDDELAGFALVDKGGSSEDIDHQIGEFFILRKFRGEGFARKSAT